MSPDPRVLTRVSAFARRAVRVAWLAFAVCVSTLTVTCGDSEPRRPNVLLISVDTLRADHLGCYGYARDTSPRIDALAAEGALFERAIAPTSWTLPSHMTMLTGFSISGHGVCDERLWTRHDANGRPIPPPLRGYTLAEALQKGGYATAGFYSFEFLDPAFGFGLGFETWQRCGHTFYNHPEISQEVSILRQAGDVVGMRELASAHPELFEPRRRTAPATVDAANAWLDEHTRAPKAEPFFLFVHLFDVHDPYKPLPEDDVFGDPAYTGTVDGAIDNSRHGRVGHMPAHDDEVRLISLYDGGIRTVDAQVGRLLDRLKTLGIDDDTLVILTSDHGEEFFEHGNQTHHRQLYIESVHVPLVMRWPGQLPPGARVPGTAGLVDIAPTICAAANVRPLSPMGGTSLIPFARGEGTLGGRMYTGLLQLFEGAPDGSDIVHSRLVALFRGNEHTIVTFCEGQPFRAERFDLEADPREQAPPVVFYEHEPLGVEFTRQVDALRELLLSRSDRRPLRLTKGEALPPPVKRMLRVTGYDSPDETRAQEANTRLCIDGCVFSH